MIQIDFQGAGVIVTGGTRGLGKAIGQEFGRAGATVFLTHRWGTVDEEELVAEFVAEGLAAPHVLESDASDTESSRELMEAVRERTDRLAVLASNVAFAKIIQEMADLRRASMELSVRYSAWPLVDLLQASQEVLGYYPAYALGISSDGGDVCHPGYEMAGVAKSALETLCRYLALRLRPEGVRVNAVRPGFLDTASSRATFGDALIDTHGKQFRDLLLEPRAVAQACVALCSGLMDSITGQVITVDEGWSLVSPVAYVTGKGWPAAFPAKRTGS